MKHYLVLQHFTWGKLQLEKGQSVEVVPIDHKDYHVFEKHHPDSKQRVTAQAIVSMEKLGRIKLSS